MDLIVPNRGELDFSNILIFLVAQTWTYLESFFICQQGRCMNFSHFFPHILRLQHLYIATKRQDLAEQLFVGDYVDTDGDTLFVVGEDLLAGVHRLGFHIGGAVGTEPQKDLFLLPVDIIGDADDVVEVLPGIDDMVGNIGHIGFIDGDHPVERQVDEAPGIMLQAEDVPAVVVFLQEIRMNRYAHRLAGCKWLIYDRSRIFRLDQLQQWLKKLLSFQQIVVFKLDERDVDDLLFVHGAFDFTDDLIELDVIGKAFELAENVGGVFQVAQVGIIQGIVINGIIRVIIIITAVTANDGSGKSPRRIAAHDVEVGLDGPLADPVGDAELLVHLFRDFRYKIVQGPLPELVAEAFVDDPVAE